MPKLEMHENSPLHIQELNCRKNVYELEDLAREELLGLNLLLDLGLVEKIPFTSFLNHVLGSVYIEPMFPYVVLPHHEGAKRDTIRVIKGTSAKLPHHRGHVPTYPMENEMSLIHHAKK